MIAELSKTDPNLYEEFCRASRAFDAENQLARESGRFPLCARGRINTYALFAEHNRAVLGPKGRAGFIVPAGLVTDDTTKAFLQKLLETRRLASVMHFENEGRIFPEVHHATRFVLMTIGAAERADLVFFAREVAALSDSDRHFSLTPADFSTLNPNTRTCPTFRSKRDADLNLALYRRSGILWREDEPAENPWGLKFMQGIFNMASDSGLFRTRAQLEADDGQLEGNCFVLGKRRMLPLAEAKMVHHFDHRFGSYEGQTDAQANQGKLPEFDDTAHADPGRLTIPRYWVDEKEVEVRLDGYWGRGWLLGWRDICRSTDQRTVIASLFPHAAVGHTTPLMFTERDPRLVAALYGNLCSFVLDYAARQKVGGTHLTYGYLKQLPVLAPSVYDAPAPWETRTSIRDWVLPRVLELTYTAWDLQSFARDVGYDGPPFRWKPERRFLLRAELDAAFFHLYGLSRDDTAYVLDTFPVVRKNDEKAHDGKYRTQRLILECYDAMAKAALTGKSYETLLAPPPAAPQVAHPRRDAEVIQFPRRTTAPAPRSLPAWGPDVLPTTASLAGVKLGAGAWATHLSGERLGISALAAVLRQLPGSCPRSNVERAVVLVLLPRFLERHFEGAAALQWRELLGSQELIPESVNAFKIPWNKVVRKAIQQSVLVETADQIWAPGPDVGDVPSLELDARALVALSWLATEPAEIIQIDKHVGGLNNVA